MLLEREAELETLGTALDAAREGRGSLLVIEGHAGLGKSQLLAAARGFAKGCGVRALSAAGTVDVGGRVESQARATRTLATAIGLAVLAVFVLL